jgi:hypothetical protein
LCLTFKNSNGSITRYALNKIGPGEPFTIVQGKWYDLDVKVTVDNGAGGSRWEVYLDGIVAFWVNTATVPASGKYGLFARGYTVADFAFLMVAPENIVTFNTYPPDFISVRTGGAVSQIRQDSIWTDRLGNNSAGSPLIAQSVYGEIVRRGQITYDEFAPVVNEIREYNIKFTKSPVVHSRVFMTNEEKAFLATYTGTPFGATMTLQPNDRMDAILNGEDTSLDINNPIQQKLLIYGRLVNQDDVKVYTVKNEAAVRRRGEVSLDLDSDWIQSQYMASVIGGFIIKHWAGGQDEINLETFNNTLVQIGDVVAVDYALMAIVGFKYFVVGIERTYDREGPTVTLTLRRARI